MSDLNKKIYKSVKFSSLLEEIHDNQKRNSDQIQTLIRELVPLVKDIGDATLLVPLIKEYMDLKIKNDDQLIKMATVIQRISLIS